MKNILALLLAALLAFSPVAPVAAFEGVPSETTLVQGTVAASAVHVATVPTGAFAFIDALDLSPYLGCKLTLRDSTGRTAVGYVMRAGTGVAGGDLALAANVSNTTSPNYDTFDGVSATGFHAVETGATAAQAGTADEIVYVAGQLWRIGWTHTATSGQAPGVNIRGAIAAGTSLAAASNYTAVAGANAPYFTIATSATGVVEFRTFIATEYTVASLAVQRVTEPPVTGVVIASTKGGAVQSWAATTTGFDPNAVTFYSISRVHVATVVASGNLGAGDGGLVLTDGSAKAVPTGVDISGYAGGYYFLTFQDTGGRVYGGYSGSVSDGTGLTIVTAKAGATQNWLIKTASFDKDVALDYKVYYVGY